MGELTPGYEPLPRHFRVRIRMRNEGKLDRHLGWSRPPVLGLERGPDRHPARTRMIPPTRNRIIPPDGPI
jgi:hypothetical protein